MNLTKLLKIDIAVDREKLYTEWINIHIIFRIFEQLW